MLVTKNDDTITLKDETEVAVYRRGIVLNTDGGARPNPGNTGWGVHGYYFSEEPPKKGSGLSSHLITSKGYLASSNNAKEFTEQVTPLQYIDFFGSGKECGSNNSAEIDALAYALMELKHIEHLDYINVFTDSEYLRRGVEEWLHIWVSKNWIKSDGSVVPNSLSWKRLLEATEYYKERGIPVNISWVKGHSDHHGNTIADLLATTGVVYAMEKQFRVEHKYSPPEGYWKTEVDRDPLLCFNMLYFNSIETYNERGHYYIAKLKGNDESIVGKKTPETSYSIVRLLKPDEVIESIKDKQFKVSNDINSIIAARLDKIYSPQVYKHILEHRGFSLIPASKHMLSLNFLDNTPITIERNPAGLSMRAIESFGLLETLLDRFIEHEMGVVSQISINTDFRVINITDEIFDTVTKTKKDATTVTHKLKSIFNSTYTTLNIFINSIEATLNKQIKIPLVLGTDLITRNNLKKIEEHNPSVNLITWKESNDAIKYAVIIRTSGGIGIWSNFFANTVLIN